MTDTQPVVTQADRDAAILQYSFSTIPDEAVSTAKQSISDGYLDHLPVVQSFAAHRTTYTAALQKQLDMAVEALEQTLERLIGVEDWRDGSRPRVPSSDAAIAFARKALAAIKEQGA